MKYKITYTLIVIAAFIIWGCSDQWDDYVKKNEGVAGSDVLETLKSNSEYSTFVSLLTEAGIDEEISSSKIYSIWAPTNTALSTYSSLIPVDAAKKKSFLLNHISYERITYDDNTGNARIKMASGKNATVNYSERTINDIVIADSEDMVVSNGVIHTLDTPIMLLSSIWDFVKDLDYEQINYMNYLTYQKFVADSATQIGIDSETGKAVYDTASGMVDANVYLDLVADLSCEDSTYTFFVIDDASFSAENDKFKKYFTKSTETETDSISHLHIVTDLVTTGDIEQSKLNGSLESVIGNPIPVSSGSVLSSYKASNGMVYFLSSYSLPMSDRIKEIFVEAEYPYPDSLNMKKQSVFKIPDGTIVTWARDYASNGHCITSPSSTYSLNYIDYFIDNVYTCKYDVYWVSVTETEAEADPASTVSQCIQRVNYVLNENGELEDEVLYTSDYIIPTYTSNIQEQYVGQFEVDQLNQSITISDSDQGSTYLDNYIRLRIKGINGDDTPIYLDYFRLVPIIE